MKKAYENNFDCNQFKQQKSFTFKMKVEQSKQETIYLKVIFFEESFVIAYIDEILFQGPNYATVPNIEKCYENILSVVSDKLFLTLIKHGDIIRR